MQIYAYLCMNLINHQYYLSTEEHKTGGRYMFQKLVTLLYLILLFIAQQLKNWQRRRL